MVKFADDTTLVGLITKDDETHYRKEVDLLTTCLEEDELTDAANVDLTENELIIGAFEFAPGWRSDTVGWLNAAENGTVGSWRAWQQSAPVAPPQ
ncbi:hypothetical protein SKAU_G00199180 [Synaphobranchus kaupii]|uniref:Reverse transcriptase domain-containing protein n=1 Tax=Synaphobranchus kaupii TaxID=118154 RepID=A0A9Q1FF66_SYNKA|nr:hypothetical protein SKAU_G00199180 [Synaphobranchus kaupii]